MNLWHARLGHINVKTLAHVLKSMNVNCDSSSKFSFCNSCQHGKLKQSSFPKSHSQSSKPIELVHSNFCGPCLFNQLKFIGFTLFL